LQSARPAARTYASAAPKAGSNLPLALATAGLAGLGGYVYLQRNPVVAEKAEGKLNELKGEAKASNESPAAAGALIKDQWTPFLLTKVEPYNHNSAIYTFSFGDDSKTRGDEVASALLVRSPMGDDEVKDDKGKPVIRPYTAISPPSEKGTLRLLIKEYKDGKLTSYMSSLTPGKSSMLFKGPIPKFKYEANSFDRGLCIAGGSGITPMWQLITHSLDLPEDKTKWTLVFSNVTDKDILLRKEWDDLAAKNPDRLSVKYVLDKEPRGWKGETGFVTPDMLSRLFPKGDDKVRAFVCGPPPQVKSIAGPKDGPRQGELQGALKELGYTAEEVFKY